MIANGSGTFSSDASAAWTTGFSSISETSYVAGTRPSVDEYSKDSAEAARRTKSDPSIHDELGLPSSRATKAVTSLEVITSSRTSTLLRKPQTPVESSTTWTHMTEDKITGDPETRSGSTASRDADECTLRFDWIQSHQVEKAEATKSQSHEAKVRLAVTTPRSQGPSYTRTCYDCKEPVPAAKMARLGCHHYRCKPCLQLLFERALNKGIWGDLAIPPTCCTSNVIPLGEVVDVALAPSLGDFPGLFDTARRCSAVRRGTRFGPLRDRKRSARCVGRESAQVVI
ncbi:hypothetical protein F4778DRAFT_711677 [Xylariomycetidae sp. FL2044]|nr:hypothetical protein F4778DRAFT_711677 [Xylariomycetidae sp. FL2044]